MSDILENITIDLSNGYSLSVWKIMGYADIECYIDLNIPAMGDNPPMHRQLCSGCDPKWLGQNLETAIPWAMAYARNNGIVRPGEPNDPFWPTNQTDSP